MRHSTMPSQRSPVGGGTSQRGTLVFATLLATAMRFGAFWDAQWHWAVGRDSFTIPPHLLIYSGVALVGLLSLLMAWNTSLRRGQMSPMFWSWSMQVFGIALLVSAAPFDNLWHERYGIDVTIWSPPHLLGILGGLVVNLGIVVGWALEWQQAVMPRRGQGALLGLVWATTLTVSMLNFALVPAVRWSVLEPGAPILYMALGSLLIPGCFIALGLITGRIWPLGLVVVGLVMLRLADAQVWEWGARWVVPAWGQTVRRADSQWFDWNFTLHVILNTVAALAVMSLAWSWRLRRRVVGAALMGMWAGAMTWCAVWALSSGQVFRTLPFDTQGRAAVEFHAESDLVVRLLGSTGVAPWGWALLGGALGGISAYLLVRGIRRAGRHHMQGIRPVSQHQEGRHMGRSSPA